MRKKDKEVVNTFANLRRVSKFLLYICVASMIPLFMSGNFFYLFFSLNVMYIYWGFCGVKYGFIPFIPTYHFVAGKGARGFGVLLLTTGLLSLLTLSYLVLNFYYF